MAGFLGIDYGAARVGLATAAEGSSLSTPHGTVAPDEVAGVVAQLQPDVIVIGLPRGLDGQDTAQTAAVRDFVTSIERGGATVVLQDEAGTSGVAEARLKASGRPFRRGDIDAEAAAIILQDYLDGL